MFGYLIKKLFDDDINERAEKQGEGNHRPDPIRLFLLSNAWCFHDGRRFYFFQLVQHKPNAIPYQTINVFSTQVITSQIIKLIFRKQG
jgi:hypothetical protein